MSDDILLEEQVEEGRLITLAEVKNLLEKAQKDREEMTYEQKIALEHSLRFSRLTMTKAKALVKDLMATYPEMEEKFAIRIADLLPQHPEDVMAILQKAHMDFSEEDSEKVLEVVDKHYVA